jgi:cell wall-associated NlpC family hydrolase
VQHTGGGGAGATTGEKILAKAMTQEGQPYAWGGGSCQGPTGDQPDYDYGEIGFDCSGLVAWAICQVTGRDLFGEGKRNTIGMYCRAGYQ